VMLRPSLIVTALSVSEATSPWMKVPCGFMS
jgi:hypothetical protein